MLKQIMKNAWSISKDGVKKFGGKVSDYLSAALKLAWKEAKASTGSNIEILTNFERNGHQFVLFVKNSKLRLSIDGFETAAVFRVGKDSETYIFFDDPQAIKKLTNKSMPGVLLGHPDIENLQERFKNHLIQEVQNNFDALDQEEEIAFFFTYAAGTHIGAQYSEAKEIELLLNLLNQDARNASDLFEKFGKIDSFTSDKMYIAKANVSTAIEFLEEKLQAKQADEAKYAEIMEQQKLAAIALAKETGELQSLRTWTDDCDGSACDCDMDFVTLFVDGEGNETTVRRHAH